MTEVGYELDLSAEAFGTQRETDVIAQDFDGNLSIEFEILGQVYCGERPVTELALDLVSVSDGNTKPFERGRHALVDRKMPATYSGGLLYGCLAKVARRSMRARGVLRRRNMREPRSAGR